MNHNQTAERVLTPAQSALIERLLNAEPGARQEAAAEIRRLADRNEQMTEGMTKIHALAFGSGSSEEDMDKSLDRIRAMAYRHAFPTLTPPEQAKPTPKEPPHA